jgi:hypothetical protein
VSLDSARSRVYAREGGRLDGLEADGRLISAACVRVWRAGEVGGLIPVGKWGLGA